VDAAGGVEVLDARYSRAHAAQPDTIDPDAREAIAAASTIRADGRWMPHAGRVDV
jgi:hypothetical protein